MIQMCKDLAKSDDILQQFKNLPEISSFVKGMANFWLAAICICGTWKRFTQLILNNNVGKIDEPQCVPFHLVVIVLYRGNK